MKDFTFIDRCYIEWLISSCNDALSDVDDRTDDIKLFDDEYESVALYENDESTRGENN